MRLHDKCIEQPTLSDVKFRVADTITVNVYEYQCVHCGTWFTPKRRNACFCSNQCTVLDVYYRKKKARKMFADGTGIETIAETVRSRRQSLESTVELVKSWVAS